MTESRVCEACGRQTEAGREYGYCYGPGLGFERLNQQSGAYIRQGTIVHSAVEGSGTAFLCHACVLREALPRSDGFSRGLFSGMAWAVLWSLACALLLVRWFDWEAPWSAVLWGVGTFGGLALLTAWGVRRQAHRLRAVELASKEELEALFLRKEEEDKWAARMPADHGDRLAIRVRNPGIKMATLDNGAMLAMGDGELPVASRRQYLTRSGMEAVRKAMR